MPTTNDDEFMLQAIAQAKLAQAANEVPVGAVVVCGGKIVAQAFNAPISTHDPTAHAEIRALRLAGNALGNYRLSECSIYVTLEPCAMCSGAIFHARLKEVIYGAPDPKTGVAGSVIDLYGERRLNHHTTVRAGVRSAECGALLQEFFALKRKKAQQLSLQQDEA